MILRCCDYDGLARGATRSSLCSARFLCPPSEQEKVLTRSENVRSFLLLCTSFLFVDIVILIKFERTVFLPSGLFVCCQSSLAYQY